MKNWHGLFISRMGSYLELLILLKNNSIHVFLIISSFYPIDFQFIGKNRINYDTSIFYSFTGAERLLANYYRLNMCFAFLVYSLTEGLQ